MLLLDAETGRELREAAEDLEAAVRGGEARRADILRRFLENFGADLTAATTSEQAEQVEQCRQTLERHRAAGSDPRREAAEAAAQLARSMRRSPHLARLITEGSEGANGTYLIDDMERLGRRGVDESDVDSYGLQSRSFGLSGHYTRAEEYRQEMEYGMPAQDIPPSEGFAALDLIPEETREVLDLLMKGGESTGAEARRAAELMRSGRSRRRVEKALGAQGA